METKPKYKIVIYEFEETVGREYKTTAKNLENAKKAMEKRLDSLKYGGTGVVLELNNSGEYVEIFGLNCIV